MTADRRMIDYVFESSSPMTDALVAPLKETLFSRMKLPSESKES
jgi:hypothetical protein